MQKMTDEEFSQLQELADYLANNTPEPGAETATLAEKFRRCVASLADSRRIMASIVNAQGAVAYADYAEMREFLDMQPQQRS